MKINLDYLLEKFGLPPAVLDDEVPMKGFQFVVRADPYVNIHTMLLGVVDNEKICVDSEAEQE